MENTETLTDASKEVGLEINAQKTKYMLLSRHQDAGQNRDMEIANRSFEIGKDRTDQNLMQEEIKAGMNSGNAYYHSVQNLLSSRVLSKNVKFRIHKTIMLPVVLYRCETCSLTLREEHRLRIFENRLLRRIFGWKRDEVMGGWRKQHNKEFRDL
jgi:hypothetical protein